MIPSAFAFNRPLGRLVRWPLRLVPRDAHVRVLSGPLAGARWIAGSHTHGCWLGTYERRTQRAFAAAARRTHVVFDVGAHVGFYTLVAAAAVGSRGRVVAFEPLPRNVRLLREHVRLNGWSQVDVHAVAVSDAPGALAFAAADNPAMGRLAEGGDLRVPVVRLDDLVSSGQAPEPGLMKIDVEGAELRVLHGAAVLIARARPAIFLSTHSSDLHRACRAWLESAGYRVTSVRDDEIVATPSGGIGRYEPVAADRTPAGRPTS